MATTQNITSDFTSHESKILTTTTLAGILVCASFVGFFLAMQGLDLAGMVWLRSFNGLFLAAGIIAVLRYFRGKTDNKVEFLEGIRLGLRTTIIAVVPFSFFIFMVLTLNEGFLTYIQQNAWCGQYITPISAAGMLTIEGIISGFMMTYVFMMIYKKA